MPECLDHGIATDRRNRCHVKHRPNGTAASPNTPSAPACTAIAVQWRNTDKSSDSLAVELTEFWKVGEQSPRDCRTNARHAAQKFVFPYAWGPNGHPIADAVTPFMSPPPPSPSPVPYSVNTFHWDGDQLLFETNAQGKVVDIKVGGFADYLPSDSQHAGLTVWDRDEAGRVVQAHNSTGYSSWYDPPTQPAPWSNPPWVSIGGPSSGYIGPATLPMPGSYTDKSYMYNGFEVGWQTSGQIMQSTTDNYSDGLDGFQGVRSTGTGGWLTPDPFGGVVDDPVSQMPYVYDGNNSFSYSDPTGFIRQEGDQPGEGGDEGGAAENAAIDGLQEGTTALNNSSNQPDLTFPVPAATQENGCVAGSSCVTQGFGGSEPHDGIDISVTSEGGEAVVSAISGSVVSVANCDGDCNSGYGSRVVVESDDGKWETTYNHLQANSISVSAGQHVGAGEQIGKVGDTGDAKGAHLHFEVINVSRQQFINPESFHYRNFSGPWEDQPYRWIPSLPVANHCVGC